MSTEFNQEIDSLICDYILFKRVVNKFDSKNIKLAFNIYQKKCLKKLEKLIVMKTYKYRNFSNYSDLKQDAFEAILHALRTFDLTKGTFSWWASQYIKTRISRAANAHSTIHFPINKVKNNIPFKITNIPTIIDISPSPLKNTETIEYTKNINSAIDNLSPEHREVLNMTYGCNGSQVLSVKNIIEVMDIPRSRYNKLLKEVRFEIKKYFINLENYR